MGQRRKNTVDMNIFEQLERMRDEVCAYACKYMDHAETEAVKVSDDFEKRMDIQMELQDHCEHCPFKRLGE